MHGAISEYVPVACIRMAGEPVATFDGQAQKHDTVLGSARRVIGKDRLRS